MHSFKNDKLFEKYMFLFGVMATMPIIQFLEITAYVWLLAICGLCVLIKWGSLGMRISKNRVEQSFVTIALLAVLSYAFSFARMPDVWKDGFVSSVLQYFVTILFYIYFSGADKKPVKAYVKGVYISSVIQLFWGYLQLMFYYFDIDLNKIIFREILQMSDLTTQFQYNGSLKISGLCWNAGNLAPLVVFGYIYSDKIILKVAFVILAFLSGSRTMMIGMSACIIMEMALTVKKKKIDHKVVVGLCVLLWTGVLFFIFNIRRTTGHLLDLAAQLNILKNIETEGSSSTHFFYLKSILDITQKNDLISNLIGYGSDCSGYVFSHFYGIYSRSGKWVVECDYVNRLWGYGYLGFAAYYYWYFRNAVKCIKLDEKYIVLFMAFWVEGLFYNITFNWVCLLLLSIFMLNKDQINIFKRNGVGSREKLYKHIDRKGRNEKWFP